MMHTRAQQKGVARGGCAWGGRARNGPMVGEDKRVELSIEFQEAVFGCDKEFEVVRLHNCDDCKGGGVKAGTTPRTCDQCQGQGQVITMARTPLGNFQQVQTCPKCGGEGVISTPCGTCSGDGRVRRGKRISLQVPAGVDTGSRLRVREEGDVGRKGGPPGNLVVYLRVRDDSELRRDGVTIMSSVTVPYTDAILGTTVRVKTVDGMVELKIPPGTQPGTTLVMGKKGVPKLGAPNQRGDHNVTVNVSIPKRLSKEEKALVENLSELAAGVSA